MLALDSLGPDRIRDYGYVIIEHDGHHYSRFPIGTSLLATPFVFVANLCGLDLREYSNERLLQVLILALVAVADVALLAAPDGRLARARCRALRGALVVVASRAAPRLLPAADRARSEIGATHNFCTLTLASAHALPSSVLRRAAVPALILARSGVAVLRAVLRAACTLQVRARAAARHRTQQRTTESCERRAHGVRAPRPLTNHTLIVEDAALPNGGRSRA